MSRMARLVAIASFASLLGGAAGHAQQPTEMPPMPKPGPEHAVLAADVGTWDAIVEVFPGPGAPAMKSSGVEVNTLVGGMWLVTEFKGEMMGMPFEGRGLAGYDPNKKKYVGTWVDTMSTGFAAVESTYDASTKTISGVMEGPDMTGKLMKMREIVQRTGANTRVFSMYAIGADGKETLSMRISYTKRM